RHRDGRCRRHRAARTDRFGARIDDPGRERAMSTPEPDQGLTPLLEYIKDARGFDFTGYKKTSLTRRIRKRMEVVGVDDFSAYRDLLEVDQGEFAQLFDYILINVTGFFRDAETWQLVQNRVVPDLVANKPENEAIRVCHDLVQDAPISRVDLLMCRNTLMYFNAETQAKIIGHFSFALNEGGFLVLGKAEMMFAHTKAFTPVEMKRRVFTKSGGEDL